MTLFICNSIERPHETILVQPKNIKCNTSKIADNMATDENANGPCTVVDVEDGLFCSDVELNK